MTAPNLCGRESLQMPTQALRSSEHQTGAMNYIRTSVFYLRFLLVFLLCSFDVVLWSHQHVACATTKGGVETG